MARTSAPVAFIILAFAGAMLAAQNRTDFSGTWTLDVAASTAVGGGRGAGGGNPSGGQGGGLGLGPTPATLKVTQDATTLTIDETRDATTTRVVYTLTGAPTSNTVPAGRSAGQKVTTTSAWKDGKLVTTYALAASADSSDKVQYQEVRSLDRDGALIVETTIVGQPNLRRSIYKRK